MGVGAVFISTLAILRLEEPQNPPQNQQQLLAATLQPIVAFVVVSSIVVRAFSPNFSTICTYYPTQMVCQSPSSHLVAEYTLAP